MLNLIAVLLVLIPNVSFATTFYCQDRQGKPVTITVDDPSEISGFPLVNCHELTKTCSMDLAHSDYASAAFAADPLLRPQIVDALAKKGWTVDAPDSQVNGVLNIQETNQPGDHYTPGYATCNGGNDWAHCLHTSECVRDVSLSIAPSASRANAPERNLDHRVEEFDPLTENWNNACGFFHKLTWYMDRSTLKNYRGLWEAQRWNYVIGNVPECASYYGQ